MASADACLSDLPLELFLMVCSYLDARSFLALCSTCKAFQDPDIRLDPAYWSALTRRTFRLPVRGAPSDGARWQKLYRRLLTQTRVYTWGNNEKACLGHSHLTHEQLLRMGPAARRRQEIRGNFASWPKQMEGMENMGTIADMQCGGWSTTMLTSKGALYTVGLINGDWNATNLYALRNNQNPIKRTPQQLRYPPGHFPVPPEHQNPHLAIKQFSAGRSHILGLSDDNTIWSWAEIDRPGIFLKLANSEDKQTATVVVAGWNKSSAYIRGKGIVLWDPANLPDSVASQVEPQDGVELVDYAIVADTYYTRPKGNAREPDEETRLLGQTVGEVLHYIVLEHYVVFVTDLGKAFSTKISWETFNPQLSETVELGTDSWNADPAAIDVQGSFRTFAIFRRGEEVLKLDQDILGQVHQKASNHSNFIQGPEYYKIPALQNTGVIGMAFGDYHYHALHNNGQITSYGTEPQKRGCLGLGGNGSPESRIRGMRFPRMDGELLPQCYVYGRHVWFEPEKELWIRYLVSGGVDPREAQERMQFSFQNVLAQGELSEWFEREGNAWAERIGVTDPDGDGLGSYFALSVTAAGWHSGALVLVNEELAQKVRDAYIVRDESYGQDTEGAAAESASTSTSIGASWLTRTATNWVRWFLGLPEITDTPNGPQHTRQQDSIRHGESPSPGYRYTWAHDSFPRLKLSDGREMPGEIPFTQWRGGEPTWPPLDNPMGAGPAPAPQ